MKSTFSFILFISLFGVKAYTGISILPNTSIKKTKVSKIYKFIGSEADLNDLKDKVNLGKKDSCEGFWKATPQKLSKTVFSPFTNDRYKEYSVKYELYGRNSCEPDFMREELAFLTIAEQVFVINFPTWSIDNISIASEMPNSLSISFSGVSDISGPFDIITFTKIDFKLDSSEKMQPVKLLELDLN